MKLVNAAFIAATLGYGALCLGCAPKAYDPGVVKAVDDPVWGHISPLPAESGFYKMYDHEDGRLCYLVRINNSKNDDVSLECQYNEDLQPPSTPVQKEMDMLTAVSLKAPKRVDSKEIKSCPRWRPCVIPKPCLPRWPSCVA